MKLSAGTRAELVALVATRRGRARLTIAGKSMEPLLRAGMVIDVEPLTDDPRVGDILVFVTKSGLVAHRLIGGERFAFGAGVRGTRVWRGNAAVRTFVTAGDAFPDREEIVPASSVVGRVAAVWAGPQAGAARLDDARFRRRGRWYVRSRPLRTAVSRVRGALRLLRIDPARLSVPPAYGPVLRATAAFERGHFAAAIDALAVLPPADLVAFAQRHHLGGCFAGWLAAAAQAGVAVPPALDDHFRRARWINALQAGRIVHCVREVHEHFAAAGIPHIFLKGGARLSAGEAQADLQFSADVDVLVPPHFVAAALAALRAAGYADLRPAHARPAYAQTHHHREPLSSPRLNVPVEVHTALAAPGTVSAPLDYAALVASAREVEGPAGVVRVLDEVASALHLLYHGRDLRMWRDVVLLSRKLRAFNVEARALFDALVALERFDAFRLSAVVAVADHLAFDRPLANATRRYVGWAELREELPANARDTNLLESLIGRCPLEIGRSRARPLVAVGKSAAALLALVYAWLRRRRVAGVGCRRP